MLTVLRQCYFSNIKFNVDKFNRKDYQTMCLLLRQKFPIYNEAIEVYSDVKMLDQNGKLLGRYQASQARKKAINMKKDLLLINKNSVPAICKVMPFREKIVNQFYGQIVTKRNQSLLRKASSTKHLKISLNLTDGDMVIKSKQIVELAKKNLNVRIFINCKLSQVEEAAAKLDSIKASLQNKCTIETDLNISGEDENEEKQVSSNKKDKQEEPRRTVSVVVKSKSNQFMQLIQDSTNKQPEGAIQAFLKRYYKQEDVEMMDLKASSKFQETKMGDISFDTLKKSKKSKEQTKQSTAEQKQKKQQIQNLIRLKIDTPDAIRRYQVTKIQGKNRILTERLRRILQVQL